MVYHERPVASTRSPGDCCDGGGCNSVSTGPPSEPPQVDSGTVVGAAPGGPDAACVTSIDCEGNLVCGYDPSGGCAAQGACVVQVSGPRGDPACGCDGLPVQYVSPGYTSEPVADPAPCDAGAAGGAGDAAPAQDADADAGRDAGTEVDAGTATDGE